MKPILELEDLHYRYPGQATEALRGATLSVPSGCKAAILGRNGCGKSTLLLHCNGILRPDSGMVRFGGRPVTYDRRAILELRRRVGIVFQNPDDQLFSASVAQDISFGPLNLGLCEREARMRVEAAAEACGVADLLNRPTHALSVGQKARVALAGVLAMDPLVLIADEVTGSLDPWMLRQMLAIFDRLVREGKTVLVATHNLEIARCWANFAVVMDSGRVAAADLPERIFADRALLSLVGLEDV